MKMIKNDRKHTSRLRWAWILGVGFLVLGIIDIRFGLLGFLCMGAPIYHVLRGDGKVHCRAYCPRASFFDRWLGQISLKGEMPGFMRTKGFKQLLLTAMLSVFALAVYRSGGNLPHLAYALYRLMAVSMGVGVLMGVVFKPRSWCTVCPMGYGSGILDKSLKKKAA